MRATWLADLRVVLSLLRGLPHRSEGYADQLNAFYGPQAAHYDRFRERLLKGRREMLKALNLGPGQHVAEMGAGTGKNVEFYRESLDDLGRVSLIDLCLPLVEMARQNIQHPHVDIHHANACDWGVPKSLDRVYFSYSLSMIPPWFEAIDHAEELLKPGGLIGVVDFQVAPRGGSSRGFRQSRWGRFLWPLWFDHDGVRLSADTLQYLQYRFDTVSVEERRAAVPYMPGLTVPYFIFVGRKRERGTT
jgi:S-adenosylmethionine-diacylgycerolhomoserine-N-methlytransferase